MAFILAVPLEVEGTLQLKRFKLLSRTGQFSRMTRAFNSLIYLLAKRCFDGASEHLRRQSRGRLYRAKALYKINVNQSNLAMKPILDAMRTCPFPAKTLATCMLVLFARVLPRPASKSLPGLPGQFTTEILEHFRYGLDLSHRRHPSF